MISWLVTCLERSASRHARSCCLLYCLHPRPDRNCCQTRNNGGIDQQLGEGHILLWVLHSSSLASVSRSLGRNECIVERVQQPSLLAHTYTDVEVRLDAAADASRRHDSTNSMRTDKGIGPDLDFPRETLSGPLTVSGVSTRYAITWLLSMWARCQFSCYTVAEYLGAPLPGRCRR
jgi:hypothetical protein